jgi:stage III sporulation protein AE
LAVLGTLSREFPMKRLAALVRQWALTLLGLLFILFFGVLTVRGAIAPVSDGLAMKTAKFLTGTFIPVVGSRMAEALEVVVGGSMLIKNAIGGFGMATVFMLMIFPVIKVFSVYMIYRLAAALVEPISDERLVEAMSALATSLSLVIACLLTVGLMFFVSITILVSMGSVPAFLR